MLSIAFGQSKYYIDNLSENVKRGLREKLRRGEWPARAPVGYLHDYKQHTIYPDSERAPFIKKIFELYSTAQYTLESMTQEIKRWGLLSGRGKPVCKTQLARMLRNPIYYGVFQYKGELHQASHPPLISKKLFDRVQDVLDNRSKAHKSAEPKYAFTGLIKCSYCGCSITAERQKGHIYYHCTKKKGPCLSKKFLREEALLSQVNKTILKIYINDETKDKMINRLDELFQEESKASFSLSEQIKNRLSEFDEKIERLIDVYINRELSQEEYAKKKAKLLNEKKDLEERLQEIEKSSGGWLEPSKNFLTTCNQAGSVAWQETPSPQKDFLKILSLNLILKDVTLLVSYSYPFSLVAETDVSVKWRPQPDLNRCRELVPLLHFNSSSGIPMAIVSKASGKSSCL
jgi:hypothetical protein